MPTKFQHEEVAAVPAGHRVRTVRAGTHQVRIAFPPGPRQKGAGKLISILHPNRDTGCSRRKLNPVIEPLLAGAAAGAAAAVTGKVLAKNPTESVHSHAAFLGYPLIRGLGKASRDGKTWLGRFENAKGQAIYLGWDAAKQKWVLQRAPRQRNQADASEAFTEFHGRAPSEVLELQEDLVKGGDYFALGVMGGLWLSPVEGEPSKWGRPSIEFTEEDKVKLAAGPDGEQLYLVGGNQQLPLERLARAGRDTENRFVSLGEAYAISYVTEKKFDGFRTHEYAHEFGEQTGERPALWYDQSSERLVLVGGAYSIAPLEEDLGASPGIVN